MPLANSWKREKEGDGQDLHNIAYIAQWIYDKFLK